jgi:putative sigma-54 modulation protein
MELTTTARHFDLTPKIRSYCEERVTRLTRFFDQIREASIILSREKNRFSAEITLKVGGGADLVSSEETPELFAAIDGAVDALEQQLKKHKGRLQDRRVKGDRVGAVLAAEEESIEDET